MSRTRLLMAVLAFFIGLVGPVNAVIKYVELPSDVTEEELREMSDKTKHYLTKHIYKELINPMVRKGIELDYDIVVVFTKEGKNIKDILGRDIKTDGPDAELTFERGGFPWAYSWTDDQWGALWWHLHEVAGPGLGAYYLAKRVFGPPFESNGITIYRDPSLPASGMYSSLNNSIYLKAYEGEEISHNHMGTLTHEMLHAFTDGLPDNDQFGEGMVTAAAEVVQTILYNQGFEKKYTYVNHAGHRYYNYFEFFNVPEFASPSCGFDHGFNELTGLRYRICAFTWWKMYCEDENFFINFNDLLYGNTGADHGECMDMAAQAYSKSTLEGFWDIHKWLDNQPVINLAVHNPYEMQLFLVPLPYQETGEGWGYARHRMGWDPIYSEAPLLAGVNVAVERYDYDNNYVDTVNCQTDGLGRFYYHSPYWPSDMKRYYVACSADIGSLILNSDRFGHGDMEHRGVPGRYPNISNHRNMYGIFLHPIPQEYYLDLSLHDARTGTLLWGQCNSPCGYGQFYVNCTEPGLDPENLPDFMQWCLRYRVPGDPPYERTIYRNVDKATYFVIFNEYPDGDLDSEPAAAVADGTGEKGIEKLSTRAAVSASGYRVTINYYVPQKLAATGTPIFEVFDLAGRKVLRTELGRPNPGKNTYNFDVGSSNLPKGVYVYRVKLGSEAALNKFVVAR